MPQKASTPWSSRTVAEGGTDSPVGSLVPVPDEIQPVVNTGFIATTGKFTGLAADDLKFTFQDPSQALGAGASMFIDPIDMLVHDMLIVGILDSSGNGISIDMLWLSNPAMTTGPYSNPTFTDTGLFAGSWKSNDPGDGSPLLIEILNDTGEGLSTAWRFFKIAHLRGTAGSYQIRSNEGSNAGTISTAYMRLL